MKDAYFFPHDSNAKDDIKCVTLIENLGMEGYGIFWVLIETLREQEHYKYPLKLVPSLARRYNTTAEKVKQVISDYEFFKVEDNSFFYSESLIKRMLPLEEKRESNKKAAEVRWEKYRKEKLLLENASAMHMHNECNANRVEQNITEHNREEENITEAEIVEEEKISYVSIKEYWNNKNNIPKIRSLSSTRKEKIKLRIEENNIKEFYNAIDIISNSEFCLGKNDRGWKADIDWLISNDTNIIKVLEGKYKNNKITTKNNEYGEPEVF